jgi:hypothetical protein
MATFTSDTGLELDDTDPDDRKILDRQRAAARNAGSAGDDRAGATRGRPDLEAAYDEGAAEASLPQGAGGRGQEARGRRQEACGRLRGSPVRNGWGRGRKPSDSDAQAPAAA